MLVHSPTSRGVGCYVLQDANHNVIPYYNPNYAGGDAECDYDPDGRFRLNDNVGQWSAEWEYDPDNPGPNGDLLGAHGMWFDSESGLYYDRGRYYSPGLGRFLQRDPSDTGLSAASARIPPPVERARGEAGVEAGCATDRGS